MKTQYTTIIKEYSNYTHESAGILFAFFNTSESLNKVIEYLNQNHINFDYSGLTIRIYI